MATCVATYTWDEYGEKFSQRLGIVYSEDDEATQDLLDAACVWGDQYLQNPFDGTSDLSPATHPRGVFLGLVAWAAAVLRAGSANAGLTGAMTGSLQEFYAQGLDHEKILRSAVGHYWKPWRTKPWL